MKRYVLLDLIRVIAISLLMIAHIGQTLNHPIGGFFGAKNFYYASLGGLAVTIFLVLSGMVLRLQYANNIQYSTFILKRTLRLYPIYYLSTIFGIILYFLKSYQDGNTIYEATANFSLYDIILNITGSYAFVGKWGGPFVGTSWFIALIMTLYLIFPKLCSALRKKPIFILFTTFIISFISRILIGNFDILPNRPLDWFPLCRVFEFTLGIFIADQIEEKFLKVFDGFDNFITKTINFLSQLSFPLFLIHFPICFVISSLITSGMNKFLAITCFILLSCILSFIAMKIDNLVPREKIVKRFVAWKSRA
jgi:peptidoglycan/LPS O-acetylase OafA/YrhL